MNVGTSVILEMSILYSISYKLTNRFVVIFFNIGSDCLKEMLRGFAIEVLKRYGVIGENIFLSCLVYNVLYTGIPVEIFEESSILKLWLELKFNSSSVSLFSGLSMKKDLVVSDELSLTSSSLYEISGSIYLLLLAFIF